MRKLTVAPPLVGPLLALGVSLALPTTPAGAQAPCCSIVSVDKPNGIVTLRDNKTGEIEKVTVKDPARLEKLKVGQLADRGLKQHYCSIRSFEPCLDQERTHDCQPCPDEH
jgi:hypothetical protein